MLLWGYHGTGSKQTINDKHMAALFRQVPTLDYSSAPMERVRCGI